MTVPRLRAPIVLVHGLLGYDHVRVGGRTLMEYFRGIAAPLRHAGNRVLVPRLSMTAGVAQRAAELKQFIDRHAAGDAVHLIAHSMGGLDSRHLITHLGMADRVLSLTTVGTPHRGAAFADWGLRRLEAIAKPLFLALGIPHQAFLDLTTTACQAFNERTPNAPNVRYFAVAGRASGSWLSLPWLLPYRITEQAEGPNDGVVSIASAEWGEHTDVWEGDHLNLVNVPNLADMWRGRWTDRAPLYGGLVRRLADLGF